MSNAQSARTPKTNYKRIALTALGALLFGGLILLTLLSLPSGGLAALFAGSAEAGYPYGTQGQSVIGLLPAEKGTALFSADGVTLLDKKARELYSRRLDYADPTIAGAYGRYLLANRADGRYFLHNAKSPLFEGKLQSPVTLAAVSKNHAALASQTAAGETRLEVLDAAGERVFEWSGREERITSVSLSPDGSCAAVSLLRMAEGERYSRALIFDVARGSITGEADFGQSTLLRVCFTEKNLLYVLGETLFACLKTDGGRAVSDVELAQPERFAFSENGRAALILRGEDNEMTLRVYDTSGGQAWDKSFASVSALALDDKNTAVLQGDTLEIYDKKGKLLAALDTGANPVRAVVLCKKTVYALTNTQIEQFTF